MTTERNLIVNADDYGLTPDVSRGIRDGHKNGIITSTTAMMNVEGVFDDLRIATSETPNLGIGVHLVLTFGSPVLKATDVKSIVDQNGKFPGINGFSETLQSMKDEDIEAEWRAQIEKMINAGYQPDHLDSHHHISYRDKRLIDIMSELAFEFGLPIRQAPRKYLPDPSLVMDTRLVSPDYTEVSFYGDNANFTLLSQKLNALPNGTSELMVHPAYNSKRLTELTKYTDMREEELRVLTSNEVRVLIDSLQIKLISFNDLVANN